MATLKSDNLLPGGCVPIPQEGLMTPGWETGSLRLDTRRLARQQTWDHLELIKCNYNNYIKINIMHEGICNNKFHYCIHFHFSNKGQRNDPLIFHSTWKRIFNQSTIQPPRIVEMHNRKYKSSINTLVTDSITWYILHVLHVTDQRQFHNAY